MNTYMTGTLVRETGTFFDLDGELADPTEATLSYQAGPSGAVTQVSSSASQVTRQSKGVYYYDIDTSGWAGPGNVLYAALWNGTGDVQASAPDYFEVVPSPITLP